MKLTDEQIKFFKENYDRLSMVELAVELQSNKSSLQLLAKELGLGAKKIIRVKSFNMSPSRPVIEDHFRGWF
jgi:hypothetical protein